MSASAPPRPTPDDQLALARYLAMYQLHVLPARRTVRRTTRRIVALAVPMTPVLVVCAVMHAYVICIAGALVLAIAAHQAWVASRAVRPIYAMLEQWSTVVAYMTAQQGNGGDDEAADERRLDQ